MEYQTREARLQNIKQHFINQDKLHIVLEQLEKDQDWDIRGTVMCPKCDLYIDYCFARYVKCGCEK